MTNKLAVGVDLGGTNMRASLVDVEAGTLLSEAKLKLTDYTPEVVAKALAELVREVDPERKRAGVGVGIAALLRGWTGVVIVGPNLGWREVPFRALVDKELGTGEAVELYNDLNAIALGEVSYGSAKGTKDALCIYVGTGIGAGLVTSGRLYAGATHLAGEIGHAKVVLENGRLCGCGQLGCLEAYAGGNNIAKRAHEELKTQKSSAIELAGGADKVHAGFLDQAAAAGDPYATRLWAEVSDFAGLALGAAVTLLNPSTLIMGGGVWTGAPVLGGLIRKKLLHAANAPSLVDFHIIDTSLGDSAGRLGAARAISGGRGPQ
ncbi:MAG: ROK family protein [Polyangia bacterium]